MKGTHKGELVSDMSQQPNAMLNAKQQKLNETEPIACHLLRFSTKAFHRHLTWLLRLNKGIPAVIRHSR